MIDFTKSIELYCNYGGSEKKKKIFYNGKKYLLKFPDPVREKNTDLSYVNNTFSEYIGCRIFSLLGMNTQEVLLGKYKEKSCLTKKEKIVVACQDFTVSGTLIEFSSLANSITSTDKHFTTNIEDIYDIIENLNFNLKKHSIIENFWDMFVIDTVIGNTDRHLSNFGLIEQENNVLFSLIYDCGSSLNPLLSDIEMENCLKDFNAFKDEVYNIHPVFKYEGKRLTYKEFYDKNINDLNKAVLRIVPRINLDNINKIIDETPIMSDVRKKFLKESIKYRKEKILDVIYNKIIVSNA